MAAAASPGALQRVLDCAWDAPRDDADPGALTAGARWLAAALHGDPLPLLHARWCAYGAARALWKGGRRDAALAMLGADLGLDFLEETSWDFRAADIAGVTTSFAPAAIISAAAEAAFVRYFDLTGEAAKMMRGRGCGHGKKGYEETGETRRLATYRRFGSI